MAVKKKDKRDRRYTRHLTEVEEAFYRQIWHTPNDFAPKFVFADWLQENNQEDYANFIRQSIHLEKLFTEWQEMAPPASYKRRTQLISIKRLLQDQVKDGIYKHLYLNESSKPAYTGYLRTYINNQPHLNNDTERLPHFSICTSGFITYVRCSLNLWINLYGEQTCHHPIQSLIFPEKIPYRAVDQETDLNRKVFWTFGQFGPSHSSYLPFPLTKYILKYSEKSTGNRYANISISAQFPNPKAAIAALNTSALEWARDTFIRPTSSQS